MTMSNSSIHVEATFTTLTPEEEARYNEVKEVVHVEATFTTLTPEEEARYNEVKEVVRVLCSKQNGLRDVLNALLLTGDSALTSMQQLMDVLQESSLDARDLAGIINDRPLSLPRLINT